MSRTQLKPQGVTVLPLDKQRISFEAEPPPVLWHTISNGAIQADSKLSIVSAPGTVSGSSGNALYSGGGRLEFTINDNQRPSSSGVLSYSVFNSNSSVKFEVQITSSAIVVKDLGGATLFSQAYTPTTGDVFIIYISDSFRLNKNGIQLFGTNIAPISFPCTFTASLTTPVVGASPAIAPPALIGEWKIAPAAPVVFTLGGGNGALTTITGVIVEYTGSLIPGDHSLIAWLAQAQDSFQIQRATAVLSTPALRILGESAITLQPGQKIRPKTNYDKAATLNLVTWSIVSGGGTFANGEFTAPTTPGATVLRATSTLANQIADLTITVPAVITPEREAFAGGEAVDWLTNLTSPVWSSIPAGINPNTGLWIAPQLPVATARITAASGGTSVSRDVDILEKFPFDLSAPIKWERRKTALVNRAEDRTRTSRVKDKGGKPFEAWENTINNLEVEELETLHDFWDRHHPGTPFIFEDKLRGASKIVYSDSDLSHEANSDCSINVSFRWIEA